MALISRVARHACCRLGNGSPATTSSVRAFAAREGASPEENYGKETDGAVAPPVGAGQKEGYDLDKKADSKTGNEQSPEEAVKQREEAVDSGGQTEGSPPDVADIPQGPSGRPDDPQTN